MAWELERSILPLRHRRRLTPAAQSFMSSTAPFRWQEFHNTSELARIISLDLVRILDHPSNRYGLTVSELELLKLHGKRIRATPAASKGSQSDDEPGDKDPGGAEGGGVLLDIGHQEPLDGVALGEDN